MSKIDRLNLLKEYLKQALENTLKEVDINDSLKVIESKKDDLTSEIEEEKKKR